MILSNPYFSIKSISLDAPTFFLTNKKGHGLAPGEMVLWSTGKLTRNKYAQPMEKNVHEGVYILKKIRRALKRDYKGLSHQVRSA
jgi:hypothetical protein